MQVREEIPADASAIARVTAAAFEHAAHSSKTEARIVETLRAANALALSLVATNETGRIAGHVAFSRVAIAGTKEGWFGLGPVSVLPDLQRQGIGSMLIGEGLQRLRLQGAAGCVVLGNPAYYGRFGFAHDPALTYKGQATRYLQRLTLDGAAPKGDVTYHAAFDAT